MTYYRQVIKSLSNVTNFSTVVPDYRLGDAEIIIIFKECFLATEIELCLLNHDDHFILVARGKIICSFVCNNLFLIKNEHFYLIKSF